MFEDHPGRAVHVDQYVEQVDRLLTQRAEPMFQVGGVLVARRRGKAQRSAAQRRRELGDEFLAGVLLIAGAYAEAAAEALLYARAMSDLIRNSG